MKRIIKSLVVVFAVAAIAGGATYAYFNDSKTISNNTFSAGTLSIELDANGIVNNNSTTPTLPVSLTNLYPGYNSADTGNYYYPAVANTGSLDFNWKFGLIQTSNVPGPNHGNLNDVLQVKIEESLENGGPWAYPAGGSFNCQNSVIWSPITYPNTTNVVVYDGNVSAYSGAVDMGTLAPGKGRCYRMSFSLDSSVGNPYQGSSAEYTIGVDAESIH
ncbi:MAG: TasA family protein [Parcubacteria group bacterium]|jgi:predicted ribosomally synthesized peptide with SipW-like signal peptide